MTAERSGRFSARLCAGRARPRRFRRLLRAWGAASAALCAADWCSSAAASNPLNSKDQTSSSANAPPEGHTDVNLVPFVGGTTDIGYGVGQFSGITRTQRGYDPYVWDLSTAAMFTFKAEGGGVQVPFQDVYAKLTIPRLLDKAIRLEVRPSYTWESTLGYYGMGNASTDARPPGQGNSYFWYGRLHPALNADLRWRLRDHLAARIGARYTQNWLQVKSGTKLAYDLVNGSPETKKLLGSTDPHAVTLFTYGIQWDDRDSEISAHSGSFEEAAIKLSPGGAGEFLFRYGQANLTSRVYVSFWSNRLTLAARLVGDVLFGDPPFYELSRFEDAYAIGGPQGVRGVPAERYYGKVKLFGNLELREHLVSFHALGKDLALGAVAFFDGGRVWADTTPQPALNGTGLGLKYGIGVGARLQSGQVFVVRADIAWSPDAYPIGGYFEAGQVF
jgi:outer membrane protein assembly factor BamA